MFSSPTTTPGYSRASHAGGRRLGDLGEELVVRLRGLELVDQELEAGGRRALLGQGVENPAQLPDLGQLVPGEEELLMARARRVHVDGREEPPLGELAVELELPVPGALELLEDVLVHLGVRVDERGRDDRERAALLHVAGRTEEPLRRVQRTGVDTTGHDPARRGRGEVVGPRQARDAVEEDGDVLAELDEALGALDG